MSKNGHVQTNGSCDRIYEYEYSTKHQQDLINAFEAEEEKVYNTLSRQLNALLDQNASTTSESSTSGNHTNGGSGGAQVDAMSSSPNYGSLPNGSNGNLGAPWSPNPYQPAVDAILETLRTENGQLRRRVIEAERDYVRVTRVNDAYREELIELRMRLGLPIDNLIGISSSSTQPPPSISGVPSLSSPATQPSPRPSFSIPINRPSSTSSARHISTTLSSTQSAPSQPSTSTSSSSPAQSPLLDPGTSILTSVTSPPASASLNHPIPVQLPTRGLGLTYPSVPPPSLSSSFGSPVATYRDRAESVSPVEPLSRRNSVGVNYAGGRRGGSVERGARVAEVGSLARSRAGSTTSYRGGGGLDGDEIFIVEE